MNWVRLPAPFSLSSEACIPHTCESEAHLLARQGGQRAAEFEKILNHPGVVVSQPIGALAHLRLARASHLSGNNAKAKAPMKIS
jgi:hypothetical protein